MKPLPERYAMASAIWVQNWRSCFASEANPLGLMELDVELDSDIMCSFAGTFHRAICTCCMPFTL